MERVGADTNVVPIPRRTTGGHVRSADHDEARKALVRCISSAPEHIQWLRDHVTKVLIREAGLLEVLGDAEGADHLRRRAVAHQRGDTPLW